MEHFEVWFCERIRHMLHIVHRAAWLHMFLKRQLTRSSALQVSYSLAMSSSSMVYQTLQPALNGSGNDPRPQLMKNIRRRVEFTYLFGALWVVRFAAHG